MPIAAAKKPAQASRPKSPKTDPRFEKDCKEIAEALSKVERNDVLGRLDAALRIRAYKAQWKDRDENLEGLAERLKIHLTTVHDYSNVAEQWAGARGELQTLLGRAEKASYLFSWSHLVTIQTLTSGEPRFEDVVNAAIENHLTVRELTAYLADGSLPTGEKPKPAAMDLARLTRLAARHVENLGRRTWRRLDDGLERLPKSPSAATKNEVWALAQAHEACERLVVDATKRAKQIEDFLDKVPSGQDVLTKVRAELQAVADKKAKKRGRLRLLSSKSKTGS